MSDETKQREPVDIHVGAAIRCRRKALGMSQDALADQLKVTAQQVQKYETAASRISASKLFQAARALKVPVSYLFADIEGVKNDESTSEVETNIAAFLNSSDGQELAIVFPRIEDKAVRKQFLGLARAMAQASGAGKSVRA